MMKGGLFPRVGAYAVLALGFWLMFQAFETSNILTGILGGAIIIAGMYLMTGVWRDMFAKFGGNYQLRKENSSSDDTSEDRIEGTGDLIDGSDQGGELPPK
ncbi:MAG: hypothetical protein CL902_01840 [Dehalococcoidia bacterium]|nr:hypothetical protein [Dehalococcoidia bacterium]